MDAKDLADALVKACREHCEADLLTHHYAEDAVSIEASAPPGGNAMTCGLDGIRAKHAWWEDNVEVHDSHVEGPFMHGVDRFAVIFIADITMKATQERSQMKEVAIYTVANDKIIREEFFYSD